MRRTLLLCGVLVVLGGCSGSREVATNSGSAARKPDEAGLSYEVTPLSDGHAYLSAFDSRTGKTKIWIVVGAVRKELEQSFEFPTIVPLADGTAILTELADEKVWLLKADRAFEIRDVEIPVASLRASHLSADAGYWFTQWVQLSREFAKVSDELESLQSPPEQEPEGGHTSPKG